MKKGHKRKSRTRPAAARLAVRHAPRVHGSGSTHAAAIRPTYGREERQVIVFLMLPFLLMALSIGASQVLRRLPLPVDAAAKPPAVTATREDIPPSPSELTLETRRDAIEPLRPLPPQSELKVSAASPNAIAALPPSAISSLAPPVTLPPATNEGVEKMCVAAPHAEKPAALVSPAPQSPEAFGLALAAAARAQLDDFVVYNDAYMSMSYPMGDVPAFYGVCTDLVVRAYRTLGVDLQELVQQTGSGSGDHSIDHRRTETLRRLFGRFGETLAISDDPEDYSPGDLITYYRPLNTRSRAHIAIVADRKGASGRPMIVHNRGDGPQLEDALFLDPITGHYRFQGVAPDAGSKWSVGWSSDRRARDASPAKTPD